LIVSRSIAAVSVVAALGVAATTGSAGAATRHSGTSRANAATPPFVVVVQPTAGQPGDYFNTSAKPGTTIHAGTLMLRNTGRRTVRALLVPVDALTASNLGSTYRVLGTPRHGPTLWTHLSQRKLTLAPHASATVAVTVTVPAGAKPGEYLSGISIQARKPSVNTRRLRSNVEIASIVRYAVGVEIRIPGPLHPAVTLNRVTLQRQPRGLAFLVDATNNGNEILKNVTGTVVVTQGGRRVVQTPIGPGTFVTATSIQLAALSMQQQVPEGAVFHVQTKLHYHGGSAKLDRDLTFGSREAQLQQEFGGRKVASSGGSAWVAIAAGGTALLVCLIALVLLLRRRRGRSRSLPAARAALERALDDPRRAGAPVSVITAFLGETEPAWRADTQSVIRGRLRPTDTLAADDDGALVIIAADTGALAAAGLAEDLRSALARELPAVGAGLSVGTATGADDAAVAGELLATARSDRQPVAQ
jgi:hypothetical protein